MIGCGCTTTNLAPGSVATGPQMSMEAGMANVCFGIAGL
jgi:hypothetical protein